MTLHGTTTASWLQYERTVNACLYTTVSRKIIDLARRASGPVHLARDLRPIGETDRSLKERTVDWRVLPWHCRRSTGPKPMHSLYSNPTLPPCGRLTIVNRRHQVHVALEWLTKEWKTGSFKLTHRRHPTIHALARDPRATALLCSESS
ncbi:hypothetical protein PISMIDRAFT_147604 [Pisolithus microcarpus 441]|uniref:Uncharacterized protein n=1 Tax=Pisolithus microcarpus 441 TaxID=765257 RepID=A0A0C9ZPJ5_9AGAM|nr:hypothetical protein PISMIDRAFT_147604 [Pisolithus microcarpus 441]